MFREAGLTEAPPSSLIVEWWDEAAALARSDHSAELTRIGRQGERLSIAYEFERVGERPFWEAVKSNKAGYDLISKTEAGSTGKLLIEVKGSSQGMGGAAFFVSRREWQVARHSESYVFHLWLVGSEPQVAVVRVDEVEEHVAEERGDGEWEAMVIPMAAFNSHFRPFEVTVP